MYSENLNVRIILIVLLLLSSVVFIFRKKLLKTNDAKLSFKTSVFLMLAMVLSPNISITLEKLGIEGRFVNVELINPFDFLGVITIITATQSFGIIVMNVFSGRAGTLFMAIFGGIASSTTLTQLFGLQSKKIQGDLDDKTYSAIAVIANGSSMFEKIFLIGAINPDLLKYLMPFLIAHLVFGIAIGSFQLNKVFKLAADKTLKTKYFELSAIIIFAVLLFVISFVNQFIEIIFEKQGDILATGISYLGGLNVSLIEVSERAISSFSLQTSIHLIMVAFIINILTKIFSADTLGTKTYSKYITIGLLGTLILSLIFEYIFILIWV